MFDFYIPEVNNHFKLHSILVYNKNEFWTLPWRSRRSNKHRWNLHHLLPQPIPTKHDLNPIQKRLFLFELFYLLLDRLLRKRINQKEIDYFWIGFKSCFLGMGQSTMENPVKDTRFPVSSWQGPEHHLIINY